MNQNYQDYRKNSDNNIEGNFDMATRRNDFYYSNNLMKVSNPPIKKGFSLFFLSPKLTKKLYGHFFEGKSGGLFKPKRNVQARSEFKEKRDAENKVYQVFQNYQIFDQNNSKTETSDPNDY